MAVLIPVVIELWQEQFQVHNLGQKAQLDEEWDKQVQKRYLNDPLASISIFMVMGLILPIFIGSNALFYTTLLYGIFVLVHVFYVAFYMGNQINIYNVAGLNPKDSSLPTKKIMSELANLTLGKTQHSHDDDSSDNDVLVWRSQLSEELTLKKFCHWIALAINSEPKDRNEYHLWTTFFNFLSRCDISTVWLSAGSGAIKRIFKNEHFYENHILQASKFLKIITDRFTSDSNYYESIGSIMRSIPTGNIKIINLEQLFMPAFITFFAKSKNDEEIIEHFPKEFTITMDNLVKEHNVLMSASYSYTKWIKGLQDYSVSINEPTVQKVTETVFPEVETMLFAKFVLLHVNMQYVIGEDAIGFQDNISRWNIFGHISRSNTTWMPSESDDEVQEQFKQQLDKGVKNTIEVVKNLSWFPDDMESLKRIGERLTDIIRLTTWNDNYKKSWLIFAHKLASLAKTK
jgi:hypothetical protein